MKKLRHSLARAGLGVRPVAPADPVVYPSMVIVNQCRSWELMAHEFGHIAGLNHRGDPTGNNPGELYDSSALMHHGVDFGWEINDHEAGFFNTFNNQIWNESRP